MSENNLFEESMAYCLRESRIPYSKSKEEVRLQVMKSVATSGVAKQSGFSFLKIAAAILVLLMGSTVAYYVSGIENIENQSSSVATFVLPDGSLVKLNRDAVASYNNSTWFLNREIDLTSGEAFFEVEIGKKFTVKTELGNISVLGTSFNVDVSKKNLSVACKTGKVKVEFPKGEAALILTPGMVVNSITSINSAKEIDASTIGSWTKGKFAFENVSLNDVFKTLENQTDYSIEFSDSLNLKYSGQFDIDQPIADILELVCIPLSLNYSIDLKKKLVTITKN